MKRFSFLLVIVFFLSCSRGWKNPLESDPELVQPAIEQIVRNADSNIEIYLKVGYSQEINITVERKTIGGFDPIRFVRLTQSTLVDTSFDKEFDHNFTYRVRVEKNGYRTDYSAEKSFAYVSNIINTPKSLQATILELQGIKLIWKDGSSKEKGYKVEKKEGSHFVEIASLSANSESYFDRIEGIPPFPLELSYRVRAFNNSDSSQWRELATSYSGIGVPTNLHITDTTFYRFTIEWQDHSNIETGYVVERNKNGGLFGEIAQLNANTTQYTYRIAETGSYGYRVRAKKDNLNSLYSNEVSHSVKSVLPTEGLIAYYPFNGNANDESGSGNHGVVSGATLTNNRFGYSSAAYSFDGMDDFVRINNFHQPGSTGAMTVQAWIKPSINLQQGSRRYQITSHDYGSHQLQYENGSLWIEVYGQSHGLRTYSQNTNFSGGTWHHIVFSVDVRAGVYCYIDGMRYSLGSSSTSIEDVVNRLHIGFSSNPPYYFHGTIDDVRIYSRALTETEVQVLYHEGGWGN